MLFSTIQGSTFDRAVQESAISIQVEGQEADGAQDLLWSVVVSGICEPDFDAESHAEFDAEFDAGFDAHASARSRVNAVPFSLLQGWRAPMPRNGVAMA
jgi:hypothetical protein